MREEMQPVYSKEYQNSKIERILLYPIGLCEVQYKNGSRKTIPISGDPAYYVRYGLPLSDDGRFLFVSSRENGLSAYDLENACVLWRYQATKITNVFVFPSFVVALQQGTSLVKLDLQSGQLLDELKSADIEHTFLLNNQYLLADSIGGNVCAVDIERFQVEKSYRKDEVNPNQCLNLMITDATLTDREITISGFEADPGGNTAATTQMSFTRILDSDFSG